MDKQGVINICTCMYECVYIYIYIYIRMGHAATRNAVRTCDGHKFVSVACRQNGQTVKEKQLATEFGA